MRNNPMKRFLLCALAAGMTLLPLSHAKAEWNVKREQLQCVVDNLDLYAKRRSSAIIIDLQNCPPSSAYTALPKVSSQEQDGLTNVIVLEKGQLRCLRDYLAGTNDPITLPEENLCQ